MTSTISSGCGKGKTYSLFTQNSTTDKNNKKQNNQVPFIQLPSNLNQIKNKTKKQNTTLSELQKKHLKASEGNLRKTFLKTEEVRKDFNNFIEFITEQSSSGLYSNNSSTTKCNKNNLLGEIVVVSFIPTQKTITRRKVGQKKGNVEIASHQIKKNYDETESKLKQILNNYIKHNLTILEKK
ncbi:hypothetical protein M0812_26895 [Anaeramoeba flamelloides]|uniref:Uncharacterized protein n=1 Tax=Anaeramoeba flamelloides TaxID=1746091 RepID=A0AAV7YBX6_9EUKA|nr:hypothetical protein M0812_26895 [Anaeramoeba flamelloides]